MSMALPIIWTLEEALEIIRALQPETRKYQYHLCLGGGVLNKGRSEKDLDLYFLPMGGGKKPDPLGLNQWLRKLWGEGEEIGGLQPDGRMYPDEPPYLKRQKFMYGKLRIDVFILGQEKDLEGFEGEPRIAIDIEANRPQPAERHDAWRNRYWGDPGGGVINFNENQARLRGLAEPIQANGAEYWGIQRDRWVPGPDRVPAIQPAEAAQEGARAGQVRIVENANVAQNEWYVVGNGGNNNWVRWEFVDNNGARIAGGPGPDPGLPVVGPQPVQPDEDR